MYHASVRRERAWAIVGKIQVVLIMERIDMENVQRRDRYHTRSPAMQFPASILNHSPPHDFDETIARSLGRTYLQSSLCNESEKITTSVARLPRRIHESSDDVDLGEGKCIAAREEQRGIIA
jgi:hypothetical protein